MKNRFYQLQVAVIMALALVITGCNTRQTPKSVDSLKDAFAEKFYFGTAINENQILEKDTAAIRIVKKHFNAIVAENCMKSEVIQPVEGKFDFSLSDKFIEFGEKYKLFITGHVLIWHSQAPKWFFVDAEGKDVSREVLIERMKKHISTLVSRYKGKVKGWDVVNEAILDDGSWRKNKFYEIIGKDYVALAFRFAHAADPDAELYYNDYSMAHEGRRNGVVKMVKELQEMGIKVDGIGMQTHCNMVFPPLVEFEKSLVAFSGLGVKVMITEMDITVLPSPKDDTGADVASSYEFKKEFDPYSGGLPDSVSTALYERYLGFFKLFKKHQDKISRVTIWGIQDGQSWRNYWPIAGRTDYPLLFDRNYQPKKIVETILHGEL